MEINPISEDLIKQNQENKNPLNHEMTNPSQGQAPTSNPISNKSDKLGLAMSNDVYNLSPINKIGNIDSKESRKERNELIAINVFAILGIVSNSIYLANILLTTPNMTALSVNSFSPSAIF